MQSSSPSNDSSNESPRHFYQQLWVRYASLLMVLFIVVGFWLYSESLIASIESLRSELNRSQSELGLQRAVVSILGSPGLSVEQLVGTTPGQQATVFLDVRTCRAALMISNLPPTAQGSGYHVWVLTRHRPMTLGSFTRNPRAAEPLWFPFVLDSTLQKPEGFLVSLEFNPNPNSPSQIVLRSPVIP